MSTISDEVVERLKNVDNLPIVQSARNEGLTHEMQLDVDWTGKDGQIIWLDWWEKSFAHLVEPFNPLWPVLPVKHLTFPLAWLTPKVLQWKAETGLDDDEWYKLWPLETWKHEL